MNRKIDVRSGAIAAAVMAMAMLTALVTNAAAAAQQGATPAIEIAQASQLQNLQPGYVSPGYIPQQPNQGAPDPTLTLPQAALLANWQQYAAQPPGAYGVPAR